MTSWEFPTSAPVNLFVRIPAGSITVTARDTQTATVTLVPDHDGSKGDRVLGETRVEFEDGTLSIIAPQGRRTSLTATIDLPDGSSCDVKTASADTRCSGRFASLEIDSASGDVEAELVSGSARVRTASGDVRITEAGSARVDTGSGDVWLGASEDDAQVQSASGDVYVGRVGGDATVRTASGDVRIAAALGSSTEVNSASGDINVSVATGIGVYLDLSSLSGDVSSDLEPSDESGGTDMTLRCRSISGDIDVTRAAQSAAR
jgi:Putative adhesin